MYWPSYTANAQYRGEEESEGFPALTNGQENSCDVAGPLPGSSADPSFSASLIARTKAALNLPGYEAGDDWRASKAWKDQQRTGKTAAQEEPVKFVIGEDMLPMLLRMYGGQLESELHGSSFSFPIQPEFPAA